jgi:hypothetical protein
VNKVVCSFDFPFLDDLLSWGFILARHLDLPLRSHNYTIISLRQLTYLNFVGILLDKCEIALICRNL